MPDRFVTRNTTPIKPLEDQGVPLAERQVLEPFCTCFIASSTVLGNSSGTLRVKNQGHRDPNGRPICQVHFPQDKFSYESSALGGKDDLPRL